jgi:uncharacterized protein involved in tolerance to divalent cations
VSQWLLITKTKPEHALRLEQEIKNIHPYTIPAIVQMPITTNHPYFAWTSSEINPT